MSATTETGSATTETSGEATVQEQLSHCRELEYILLGDLRDLLEEDASAETVRWLTAVLDELLKTLPQDFQLCSESGYLQHVIDEHPDWEPLVERLECQHLELYQRLRAFRSLLKIGQGFGDIAVKLKFDLECWIGAFSVHRQHELRLISLAHAGDNH